MIENCIAEEKIEEQDSEAQLIELDGYRSVPREQPENPTYPETQLIPVIGQIQSELSGYKEIASSIVSKLNYLETYTEEVFVHIGDKLPDINQSFRGVEEEADRLLGYFRRESGLLEDGQKKEDSDLNRLNRASSYLIKVASDQGDAFAKMSELMKRIDNIKDSIESIREFSAEMEMLSLNAAIVAIKAGESGRTLNPITVELKKMANSAIGVIDEIVETSKQLADKYGYFQELSEQQIQACKNDAGVTGDHLTQKYATLQGRITGLVEWLNQALIAVKESSQPISSIMHTLQMQDILKQCTDHVRLSLEEASSEASSLADCNTFDDDQLTNLFNSIEFQEKVPLLCIELLDDIDMRLEHAVGDLAGEFNQLNDLLLTIATCLQHDEANTESVNISFLSELESSFKGIETVVIETAGMLQNTSHSWEQLWSTAVSLESMLQILEQQFRQLKKLTNFKLINIPIKIEVARSTGLSKDGELSERVEGLAEYISTEMRQAHKGIVSDYQFLGQMVSSMNKHKKEVEQNLESIALDVENLLDSFSGAKDQVKTTASVLCNYVSELLELVHESLQGLDRINQLIEQNRELKDDFKRIASLTSEAKRTLSSAVGTINWELHDGRLNEIVDKFTVLSHKKIAEDLYEISVEDGNQEGELILF